ncbi:MAG: N-acetylneuraminate synthase family protein [Anaerolineales bacterium]|nr:N-acetylneuraminate synthase family protein [Anaerolineales bacterium]
MDIQTFAIGSRRVGPGEPCLVIGEVAQAHDGSLGMAHAFLDAIAAAGAEAVKFQTHIARAESSADEPFRVKFSQQDATRYDYWKRMEFSAEQWAGLADHAREKGLIFLSSPFSDEAVDLLTRLGMPAWKIPSGEVTNPLLFERIAASGAPVLLSSGMSSLAEIDRAVAWIRKHGLPLGVFQCTSQYPSPPEGIGLNLLDVYRSRYGVPVGLSDHSGTIYAGLAAATLGASMLEVHVTLSREMFGPDVPASITTGELRQLVDGVRFVEKALANPQDKDAVAGEMAAMRQTFGKALVAARDLAAGTRLQRADLSARKPASAGIPAEQLEAVLGKQLKRPIASGAFITRKDLA